MPSSCINSDDEIFGREFVRYTGGFDNLNENSRSP